MDYTRTLTRGDTDSFTIKLFTKETSESTPVKRDLIPGDTVYFTVKRSAGFTDKVFQKVITTFVDGNAEVFILHEDTKDLPIRAYEYDIQVTFNDGMIKTVIPTSPFILEKEVTYE